MRRVAVFALIGFLSACNTVSYDFSDLTGSKLPFGDTDPYDWTGTSPANYPVHGVDVSKFQKSIDWGRVKSSGISFAFIKATEGGDRLDGRFAENWTASRRAGIARGAYHFFYFCRPAIEQAQWFIRNVPRDSSALPPVLDMEWNPKSPTCTKRPPARDVRAEMRVFLQAITRHYGKRPLIYTTVDFFQDNNLSGFQGYDFWLRSTAGHPAQKYGRQQWRFWQYTGTGIVPGITGDADINVFHGGTDAWRKWLKKHTG